MAATWPVLLATGRGIAARRVVLWDAPAIAVGPRTAERLAAEEVAVHVPLAAPVVAGARALVGAAGPGPSGWLTGIVLGGGLPDALRAAGAGEEDPVTDPVLAFALGRLPDDGCRPEPWLQ